MLQTEGKAVVARAARAGNLPDALRILRELPLDDFGLLMLDPAAHGLGALLPPMPPQEVQQRWTGSHGALLLPKSVSFMRTLESLNARTRRTPMFGARFLDYGCGWGRLLRLALYYSDPDKLVGVDAWDISLGFCREAGLPVALHKIAPVPETLPALEPVDIAYAFSIFTHLPERTLRAALTAVRAAMAKSGMFVITFRPVEFWSQQQTIDEATRIERTTEHEARGFTFQASPRDPGYGDASMSHAFIDRVLSECGWRRVAFDRTLTDPFQEIVAAVPV